MKTRNKPQKETLLVSCLFASVLLATVIPAQAAFQPSVERSDGSILLTPHKTHNYVADREALAVARRPEKKAKPRPDPRALHAASLRGDLATVQKLVRDRVDIHYANSDGETALHMAASRGHLPVVIFLISQGAYINARTRGNWIPLHHAVRFNRQRVASYLLAKGAPANFRTSDGVDSLDIARAMGNRKMIDLVGYYMRR